MGHLSKLITMKWQRRHDQRDRADFKSFEADIDAPIDLGTVAAGAASAAYTMPANGRLAISHSVALGHLDASPTDAVFGTPTGRELAITSSGAELPVIAAGDFFNIRDATDPDNDGLWQETGGTPTTSAITATKQGVDNAPVADAVADTINMFYSDVDVDVGARLNFTHDALAADEVFKGIVGEEGSDIIVNRGDGAPDGDFSLKVVDPFGETIKIAGVTFGASAGLLATDWNGSTDGGNSIDASGATDNKFALCSLWYKLQGGDATPLNIFRDGNFITVKRESFGKLRMAFQGSGGGQCVDIQTASGIVAEDVWHHFLAAANVGVGITTYKIFIDGVENNPTTVRTNDVAIDWSRASVNIAYNGSSEFWDGLLSEMYLTNEFLDITVLANRLKFRTAGGAPVPLGPIGAAPTGTQPLYFFPKGGIAGVNLGSLGNATIVGSPVSVDGPGV